MRGYRILAILILLSATVVLTGAGRNPEGNAAVNYVDERNELVSLVFRLAGSRAYSEVTTEYQRSLNSAFNEFNGHPVIQYVHDLWAQEFWIGFDAVFAMAIHLEKAGDEFILLDNIDLLVEETAGMVRWTRENAPEFVRLLNDFYTDINFSEFFQRNTPYYLEQSARFADELYNNVNLAWFGQFGKNPDNMRVILSPSTSQNAYGRSVYCADTGDSIIYAGLFIADNYSRWHNFVAHEFAHSFSNPMAEVWYAENEEFRRLVDDTFLNSRRLSSSYSIEMIVAYEYLTRAHTILYMMENTNANLWRLLFEEKYLWGFPNIEKVYAMITNHTPMLHILVPLIIIILVLLIIVLPVFLIVRRLKRRKTRKMNMQASQ
ncbi:MAG: DUF4932 domain-containing protein [Defluviitaleaceae bacterium]|nr:DUF4932 domain-containing protein [Defluviitaleaceae bacterium]MCL2835716.1 DUF4932 domain-containing protein [Defluviitaleaceae bacterium]